MSMSSPTGSQRRDRIVTEARLLAASGRYATWSQIEDACVAQGFSEGEVRQVFDDDKTLRDEVAAHARKAHGVGGRTTE